jgi:ABC-2 type transport system permease protein
MNYALVLHLIRKDWYLSRLGIGLCAVAGALSVAILLLRNEVAGFVGLSAAVIVLVMVGIVLPVVTIVNERKRQNLAFVMSLPISPMEYTLAKITANLTGFVVIWLAITLAVLGLFAPGPFAGLIPLMLVAALAPFVAFALILSVAIVSESELGTIVVMSACNVSYTFAWYFLFRMPGVRADLASPVPIWNDSILWILAAESGVILLAFGLTFYFQSKKRNFI